MRLGKSFSRKVEYAFLRRRLPSRNWVQKLRLRGDVTGLRHQNQQEAEPRGTVACQWESTTKPCLLVIPVILIPNNTVKLRNQTGHTVRSGARTQTQAFLLPVECSLYPLLGKVWEDFNYDLGKITSMLDDPESGDKPAPRSSTPPIPPCPAPTTTIGWL